MDECQSHNSMRKTRAAEAERLTALWLFDNEAIKSQQSPVSFWHTFLLNQKGMASQLPTAATQVKVEIRVCAVLFFGYFLAHTRKWIATGLQDKPAKEGFRNLVEYQRNGILKQKSNPLT